MPPGPSISRKRPRSPEDQHSQEQTPRLIPSSDCPKARAAPSTRSFGIPSRRSILALPNGTILVEAAPEPLPITSRPANDSYTALSDPVDPVDEHNDDLRDPEPLEQADTNTSTDNAPSSSRSKLQRQTTRWKALVIPALRQPYLRYLQRTQAAEHTTMDDHQICTCGERLRELRVACLYFDRCDDIVISTCRCNPAPLQLMSFGLFGCAPVAPTLAVDIRLLQFCRQLFLRMPPSVTGFCEALEAHLRPMGVEFIAQDGIRKRFSNALRWYGELDNQIKHIVNAKIDAARISLAQTTPLVSLPAVSDDVPPDITPSVSPAHTTPHPNPDTQEASAYLRRRCPVCFGVPFEHDRRSATVPDVIVCIDANFTQKRRHDENDIPDLPRRHPDTTFLSEAIVDDMAARVEELRIPRSTTHQAKEQASTTDDLIETGMNVPVSVLNACNDSFIAADDRREKASTQFFADTGLMALLCRHDRVLWLANLKSAGEKQHYALALIEELFKNLPSFVTVGLLYDIACQLHRSCLKWGLLAEYINRILFALSVFHAYGHQWPCQVIYHPRKRCGFGLSDGEGCERFWSSIKKLIGPLRVSGFHQRLVIIDEQVKYLDARSLMRLGQWFKRRWEGCQATFVKARTALVECGVALDVLREEWAAQCFAQTRPLPRQSKNAGKRMIEAIIALQDLATSYSDEIDRRESQLLDLQVDFAAESIIDISDDLQAKRTKLASITADIARKKGTLGLQERQDLRKLVNNEFLKTRMNAEALKMRIRNRLRERRFEIERFQNLDKNIANEQSLARHAEENMKRRDPGINSLVKRYNDACTTMARLIRLNKAPAGALVPAPLPREGLYKLDVDDPIWEDAGLDEYTIDGEPVTKIPRWLGDENVRKGIRAMLQADRCKEEEARLSMEVARLQQWAEAEWTAVNEARRLAGNNAALAFQMALSATQLQSLTRQWAVDTAELAISFHPPPWADGVQANVQPVSDDMLMDNEVGAEDMWDLSSILQSGDLMDGYDDDDDDMLDDSDLPDEDARMAMLELAEQIDSIERDMYRTSFADED